MKVNIQKYIILYIIFVCFALLLNIASFYFIPKINNTNRWELEEFDEEWYCGDGRKVDIGNLSEIKCNFIITKTLDKKESGKSLCFRSKNIFFDVFKDDEKIYSFNPYVPRFCGKSYGISFHYIYLGEFNENTNLKIKLNPIYNDPSVFFDSMNIGSESTYMTKQFSTYFLNFIVCLLIMLIGVVMIITGIFARAYNINYISVVSFGVFSLLGGLWTSTETMIIQIITENSIAVHLLNYYVLMLIPFFLLTGVAGIMEIIAKKQILFIFVLCIFNFLLNTIFTIFFQIDYHDLLKLTHLIILISVLFSIYIIVKSFKQKKAENKSYIVLVVGFVFMIIGGIMDIIRYNLVDTINFDTGLYTRLGLLGLMAILGRYSTNKIITMIKLGQHAEHMKKLAYIDVLTGMKNRLAFTDIKKELYKSKLNYKYAMVQFDINNLKTVNDVLGHDAGDKHIINGAIIINNSFGMIGECYRIGGDEFLAFILDENLSKIKKSEEKLNQMITDFNKKSNSSFPLKIAYGIAYGDTKKNITFDEIEIIADKNMYENKRKMKLVDKEELQINIEE